MTNWRVIKAQKMNQMKKVRILRRIKILKRREKSLKMKATSRIKKTIKALRKMILKMKMNQMITSSKQIDEIEGGLAINLSPPKYRMGLNEMLRKALNQTKKKTKMRRMSKMKEKKTKNSRRKLMALKLEIRLLNLKIKNCCLKTKSSNKSWSSLDHS